MGEILSFARERFPSEEHFSNMARELASEAIRHSDRFGSFHPIRLRYQFTVTNAVTETSYTVTIEFSSDGRLTRFRLTADSSSKLHEREIEARALKSDLESEFAGMMSAGAIAYVCRRYLAVRNTSLTAEDWEYFSPNEEGHGWVSFQPHLEA